MDFDNTYSKKVSAHIIKCFIIGKTYHLKKRVLFQFIELNSIYFMRKLSQIIDFFKSESLVYFKFNEIVRNCG